MGEHENLTRNQVTGLAFAAAVALHVVILLIKFDAIGVNITAETLPISIKLEKTPPIREIEKQVVEANNTPPPPVSKPVEKEALTSDPVVTAATVITTASSSSAERPATVPTVNSEDFKRFLRSETQNSINKDANAVSLFSDTFLPPTKPILKDIKSETGPLGGGAYKVRRNGKECETYKSTPQSFDELTGAFPSVSTSGQCKDLKKKFDLVDKDGKIKNSDRYDW